MQNALHYVTDVTFYILQNNMETSSCISIVYSFIIYLRFILKDYLEYLDFIIH